MRKRQNWWIRLLGAPTAEPRVSLLAFEKDQAVGHMLFTVAKIEGSKHMISLLASLAVVPSSQGKAIGGKYINSWLKAPC